MLPLSSTMPELSETTLSAGSRVKWQGMHIWFFFYFQQRTPRFRWCQ